MPSLTFYTNPMSRGRIARWMLEEVGEPYETIVLDYGTTMKAPDYLAINPMGKVPTRRSIPTSPHGRRRSRPALPSGACSPSPAPMAASARRPR